MNAPAIKVPTETSTVAEPKESVFWPHWSLVIGAILGGVALPLYVLDGTRPVDGWPSWAILGAIGGAMIAKALEMALARWTKAPASRV